jgi:hypothetical protein
MSWQGRFKMKKPHAPGMVYQSAAICLAEFEELLVATAISICSETIS